MGRREQGIKAEARGAPRTLLIKLPGTIKRSHIISWTVKSPGDGIRSS
jgi:hypothetical protein